ncbi:alpha/beta hydrolase [Streptomyces sp. NPDC056161]|uniref:alpha/beta hydrolase n=1 Tax=Streptomyces sp. NPDC056161 TaxID=3345732 RepID=UPI0035D8D2A4
MSGTALLLVVITTAVQVFTVHGATGRWFALSPAAPGGALGRGPDRTVTYATLGGEQLKADLYLPKASPAAPLVVSIHGGGFISGSRGRTPYTSWLADNGYAVLDVDYRLGSASAHTWNTADQITPAAPPTLMFQGSRDHLVHADHTKAFADKLTAAGITNRYVEIPFLDHAYDSSSLNIGTSATRALMLPWLQKYVGAGASR